jgi:hypothetical protein
MNIIGDLFAFETNHHSLEVGRSLCTGAQMTIALPDHSRRVRSSDIVIL